MSFKERFNDSVFVVLEDEDPDPAPTTPVLTLVRDYTSYLREARVAFHNKCHDPETGRFCETVGGVPKFELIHIEGLDPAAQQTVSEILKARRAVEPGYTDALQAAAAEHGGELLGLKFRFKKADSIVDKMARKAQEKGISQAASAEEIGDSLRYTIALDPDNYTEGMRGSIKALLRQGVVFESLENNWEPGDAYNGVNGVFRDKETGLRIEIQFHTPESFDVKDRQIHKDYEAIRSGRGTTDERREAFRRMQRISDAVTFPPGVHNVDNIDGVEVQRLFRIPRDLFPEGVIAAAARKLPLTTWEQAEEYKANGQMSQDDWEEWVDYYLGYTSYHPGYIYPNVETGETE